MKRIFALLAVVGSLFFVGNAQAYQHIDHGGPIAQSAVFWNSVANMQSVGFYTSSGMVGTYAGWVRRGNDDEEYDINWYSLTRNSIGQHGSDRFRVRLLGADGSEWIYSIADLGAAWR